TKVGAVTQQEGTIMADKQKTECDTGWWLVYRPTNDRAKLGTIVTAGGNFTYVDASALDASAGSVTTAGANAATGTAGGTVSITAAGALAVGNVDTHGGNSSAASTAGADGGTVTLITTVGGITTTTGTTILTSGGNGAGATSNGGNAGAVRSEERRVGEGCGGRVAGVCRRGGGEEG